MDIVQPPGGGVLAQRLAALDFSMLALRRAGFGGVQWLGVAGDPVGQRRLRASRLSREAGLGKYDHGHQGQRRQPQGPSPAAGRQVSQVATSGCTCPGLVVISSPFVGSAFGPFSSTHQVHRD